MTRSPVEAIQSEIADLARDMDRVIDNVIGAVPADGTGGDEFSHECFRDALKLARNHRYALESLARQVGELFGKASEAQS
jgi:hypothetical protein